MKKLLFFTLSILLATNSFAQIFSEDFDPPITWTTDPVDVDAFNWTQTPAVALVGSPIEAFGNTMTSASIDPNTGNQLSPNEYLVSPIPGISLVGLSGLTYLTFDYAIAQAFGNEQDSLALYISTSTTAPAVGSIQGNVNNGTYIQLLDTLITTGNTILTKLIDISSFNGQTIYLLFRHHYTNGNSAVFVDNIQIINSNFSVNSNTGCIGSNFTVSNTSVGNANLNVTWGFVGAENPSLTSSSNNIENVSFSSLGTKTITQYINGVPMMTKYIDVITTPDPIFTADFGNGLPCNPLKVDFTSTSTFGLVFNFSDGDTIPVTGSTLTKTFTNAGNYSATITQTIDSQCFGTSTIPVTFTVYQKPRASFEPTLEKLDMLYPSVSFVNNSSGAVSYDWSFGDVSVNSQELSPTHLYPTNTEGSYIVTLKATSSDGCVDSTLLTIVVEESILFFVPSAFTPNGDEFNNTFKPQMITGFDPTTYNLKIFNRWGALVFESNDPEIGWDGDFGSGVTTAETQIFTYKLRFLSSKNDEVKSVVGHMSLMK